MRCPNCSDPLIGELVGALCPRCLAGMLGDGEDLFSAEPVQSLTLGPYELLSPLGRGGMGAVWRARREFPTREVALKVLRGTYLPGENVVLRLRQEAEAIAKLRHPGIVTLYEMGEADGCAWLAMELMEGGSLAERIQRTRPSPREAAALVAKVARAVHHAHSCGVLHRDLKPHNILLDVPTPDGGLGEPRVTDFGLAQMTGSEKSLTVTGEIFGTPAYMAPEQACGEGHEVSARSDVYALGAVLYELLEGSPPFAANSPMDLLRQVVQDEPPPPRGNGVDRDLATICLRALEKEPARRYGTALALAEDLERWLRGEPIHARRTGPMRRLWKWARRHPAVAVLSAALLVTAATAGVIAWRLTRPRGVAGPVEIDAATRRDRAPQYARTAMRMLDEGDWFRAMPFLSEAIIAGTGDPARDRVNRIRFESIVRLGPQLQHLAFPAEAGERLQLSGDGRVLLTMGLRQARIWDARTGAPLGPRISVTADLLGGEMNADGSRLVLAQKNGRWSLWETTTGRFLVSRPGSVRSAPRNLAVPPGIFAGERFVAVQDKEIQFYRAGDGEPLGEPIVEESPVVWAVLSADGDYLFAVREDRSFQIRKTANRELMGTVARIADREAQISEYRPAPDYTVWLKTGDDVLFHIDPPSAKIYSHSVCREPVLAQGWAERSTGLHLLSANASGVSLQESTTVFRVGTFDLGAPGVAAGFDASGEMAYGIAENGCAGYWDVMRRKPFQARMWCLGGGYGGALSDDGRTLILRSNLPAIWSWHRRKNDGAARTFPGATPDAVTFSKDSTQLVATEKGWGRRGWSVATGELVTAIAEVAPVRDPRLAPDGRRKLEWQFKPARLNQLSLRDVSGKLSEEAYLHGAGIRDAVFSPDGRFFATSDEQNVVQVWAPSTRREHLAPISHPATVTAMAFSADGTLLATMCGEGALRVWETATGLPVMPWVAHGSATTVVWSPDGRWLATHGRGTEVRVWDFSPGQRDAAGYRGVAKLLSGHRFQVGDDATLTPLKGQELQELWAAFGVGR